MSEIPQADLENIASVDFIPWELFKNKTILITGATGLIGFHVVNALLYVNREKPVGLKILAVVRDYDSACQRFAMWKDEVGDTLQFIVGTMAQFPEVKETVDYIIHGASVTYGKRFVEQPVETISTALRGTEQALQLAQEKKVKGMVYLSSMEVYGYPPKGHRVTEEEIGRFIPMESRNSYPISKLQSEAFCCAYASEYAVPVAIVRLTQTVGPSASEHDNRIFAYFKRCIQEGQDIHLKTKGETERSYLYTADAVTAILTVLLKGTPGQAYNAADEQSYGSIDEMAHKIADRYHLRVDYQITDRKAAGYPEPLYMDLDTSRLKGLGWQVITDIFNPTK